MKTSNPALDLALSLNAALDACAKAAGCPEFHREDLAEVETTLLRARDLLAGGLLTYAPAINAELHAGTPLEAVIRAKMAGRAITGRERRRVLDWVA